VSHSAKEPDPLSLRRERFVHEYVSNGGNATRAAIAAGYAPDSAHVQAHDLLRNPKVAAAIDAKRAALLAKFEITEERILQQLAEFAFQDGARDENGKLVLPYALKDRISALAWLGKNKKLFTDRIQHEGLIGVQVVDPYALPPTTSTLIGEPPKPAADGES
jgi:phage terminase small subunit